MALTVGSWNISTDTLGNGSLSITSVDASGNVAGTISVPTNQPVVGWFDATAQTVSLATVTDPTTEFFVFLGNLFAPGAAAGAATTEAVLAGTYDGFPAGIATAASGRWVASVTQKQKEKEKDKEKEGKEIKDVKEKDALEKLPPDVLPSQAEQGTQATMQHLALRVEAIEQHLGIGRPFIPGEERPDVGGQALGAPDAG